MKIFPLLIASLILLTSCNGGGGGSQAPYYVGTEGIRMNLEPGSPPNLIYYFSPAFVQANGGDENSFPIIVRLQNEGSSWSKGGVYITGFNTNYVYVEGQVPRSGGFFDCIWGDVTNINGDWTFNFGCSDSAQGLFSPNSGNWFASANLGQLLDVTGVTSGTNNMDSPWYEQVADGITVSGGSVNGESHYTMNFNYMGFSQISRGRLLLLLSENPGFSIDFDRAGVGHEYVLQGDNPSFPGGEDDYYVTTAHITNFPLGRDELNQDYIITNCYLYTTFATPSICIDPVPYAEGRKVCSQEQIDQTSSQGAPVSVTITNVRNTPQSVSMNIEVQNVGGGDVFNFGSAEICSPFSSRRVTTADKNVVILGMVRHANQELKCNTRVIRLDESGWGQATCTYVHNNQFSTTSGTSAPIEVEAWYAYREQDSRSVTIRRGD